MVSLTGVIHDMTENVNEDFPMRCLSFEAFSGEFLDVLGDKGVSLL